MPLIKITDATVEPVTLAEAKLHLRVDGSDEDALIAALITAARTDCEHRLHSTLLQSTWQLTLDAYPPLLRLEMGPVLSVDSIQYYDIDGVQQTLSSSAYRLSGHRVQPVGCWPVTQCRIGAVTVTYKAGMGTNAAAVPAPLVAWIKREIGDLYASREAISMGNPASRPAFYNAVLDHYTIWAV